MSASVSASMPSSTAWSVSWACSQASRKPSSWKSPYTACCSGGRSWATAGAAAARAVRRARSTAVTAVRTLSILGSAPHEAPGHGRGGLHRLRRRQAAAGRRPRGGRARRSVARASRRDPGRRRPRRRSTCSTRTPSATPSPASTASCTSPRSPTSASPSSSRSLLRNNVTGTLNLLDAMSAHGVGRLVFSSTCATYGDPETIPMSEDEPTDPVNAVRRLQAGRRADARHGVPRARPRRRVPALLQRRPGASGELGEDHEPETHLIPVILQAARPAPGHHGLRHGLPDARRHRHSRLHPRRRPGRRAHAGDRARSSRVAIALNLGTGTGYTVREVVDARGG